jgi:hypothetical protein
MGEGKRDEAAVPGSSVDRWDWNGGAENAGSAVSDPTAGDAARDAQVAASGGQVMVLRSRRPVMVQGG